MSKEERKELIKEYELTISALASLKRNFTCWEMGDEETYERLKSAAERLELELGYINQ